MHAVQRTPLRRCTVKHPYCIRIRDSGTTQCHPLYTSALGRYYVEDGTAIAHASCYVVIQGCVVLLLCGILCFICTYGVVSAKQM